MDNKCRALVLYTGGTGEPLASPSSIPTTTGLTRLDNPDSNLPKKVGGLDGADDREETPDRNSRTPSSRDRRHPEQRPELPSPLQNMGRGFGLLRHYRGDETIEKRNGKLAFSRPLKRQSSGTNSPVMGMPGRVFSSSRAMNVSEPEIADQYENNQLVNRNAPLAAAIPVQQSSGHYRHLNPSRHHTEAPHHNNYQQRNHHHHGHRKHHRSSRSSPTASIQAMDLNVRITPNVSGARTSSNGTTMAAQNLPTPPPPYPPAFYPQQNPMLFGRGPAGMMGPQPLIIPQATTMFHYPPHIQVAPMLPPGWVYGAPPAASPSPAAPEVSTPTPAQPSLPKLAPAAKSPAPEAASEPKFKGHVCLQCGRVRSKRYFRQHPLKPGEVPEPDYCGKCQKEDTLSEYSESDAPPRRTKGKHVVKAEQQRKRHSKEESKDEEAEIAIEVRGPSGSSHERGRPVTRGNRRRGRSITLPVELRVSSSKKMAHLEPALQGDKPTGSYVRKSPATEQAARVEPKHSRALSPASERLKAAALDEIRRRGRQMPESATKSSSKPSTKPSTAPIPIVPISDEKLVIDQVIDKHYSAAKRRRADRIPPTKAGVYHPKLPSDVPSLDEGSAIVLTEWYDKNSKDLPPEVRSLRSDEVIATRERFEGPLHHRDSRQSPSHKLSHRGLLNARSDGQRTNEYVEHYRNDWEEGGNHIKVEQEKRVRSRRSKKASPPETSGSQEIRSHQARKGHHGGNVNPQEHSYANVKPKPPTPSPPAPIVPPRRTHQVSSESTDVNDFFRDPSPTESQKNKMRQKRRVRMAEDTDNSYYEYTYATSYDTESESESATRSDTFTGKRSMHRSRISGEGGSFATPNKVSYEESHRTWSRIKRPDTTARPQKTEEIKEPIIPKRSQRNKLPVIHEDSMSATKYSQPPSDSVSKDAPDSAKTSHTTKASIVTGASRKSNHRPPFVRNATDNGTEILHSGSFGPENAITLSPSRGTRTTGKTSTVDRKGKGKARASLEDDEVEENKKLDEARRKLKVLQKDRSSPTGKLAKLIDREGRPIVDGKDSALTVIPWKSTEKSSTPKLPVQKYKSQPETPRVEGQRQYAEPSPTNREWGLEQSLSDFGAAPTRNSVGTYNSAGSWGRPTPETDQGRFESDVGIGQSRAQASPTFSNLFSNGLFETGIFDEEAMKKYGMDGVYNSIGSWGESTETDSRSPRKNSSRNEKKTAFDRFR